MYIIVVQISELNKYIVILKAFKLRWFGFDSIAGYNFAENSFECEN